MTFFCSFATLKKTYSRSYKLSPSFSQRLSYEGSYSYPIRIFAYTIDKTEILLKFRI